MVLVLVGGLPARGRDHIGQARASSRSSSWGSHLRASAAKEARRICCNQLCELLSHSWHDSSEKQPADGVHVSRQSVRFLLENFRRHVAARAHTFDHLPATVTRHTARRCPGDLLIKQGSNQRQTVLCRPVRVIGGGDTEVPDLRSGFRVTAAGAQRDV